MSKILKLNKRPILLLEVLIAFAIIALCILPLMHPHAAMLKSQKEFIRKIELDHAINLMTAHVIERLYTNEIPWSTIDGNLIHPLDFNLVQGLSPAFPFKAGYQFEITQTKPPKKENSPVTANLVQIRLFFAPKDNTDSLEQLLQNNDEQLLAYSFTQFIKRDLGPLTEEPVENEPNPDEGKKPDDKKKKKKPDAS